MKRLFRSSVNLLPSVSRRWIRHVPLVAGIQRWLLDRFVSGEPFIHKINAGPAKGLRFEVTLPQDKAIWAGTFEPEFSKVLAEAVQPGDVCYDIGGYRGYMSGVLALAGARVIVFEPMPDNIVALKTLVTLNPELSLQIRECAVGSIDGEIGFKIMPDPSMGKVSNSALQSDTTATREISVPVLRLDTLVFADGARAPSLLKIDVEGAEVDVLDGAARTLKQFAPKIFLEAHSSALAEECASRLRSLDYSVRQLESEGLAPEQTRHLLAEPP